MTEEKKKPEGVDVYCIVSHINTSKGRMYHGDTFRLPKKEAEDYKARRLVR